MNNEEKELLDTKRRIEEKVDITKNSFCFFMSIVFAFFIFFSIIVSLWIPEVSDSYSVYILVSAVGFLVTIKGAISHYKRQVKIGNILKELSLLRGTTYEEERFIWEKSRVIDLDSLEAKLDNLKKNK